MGRPSRTSDQFIVRLPDGLRDRIKKAADRNNRSMNSEIVSALEEAYPLKGFDFATFMLEYVYTVIREEDETRRVRRIKKANDYLQMSGQDMELTEYMRLDGPSGFLLRVGDTKFVVGNAAELIVIGSEDYTETSGHEE